MKLVSKDTYVQYSEPGGGKEIVEYGTDVPISILVERSQRAGRVVQDAKRGYFFQSVEDAKNAIPIRRDMDPVDAHKLKALVEEDIRDKVSRMKKVEAEKVQEPEKAPE